MGIVMTVKQNDYNFFVVAILKTVKVINKFCEYCGWF